MSTKMKKSTRKTDKHTPDLMGVLKTAPSRAIVMSQTADQIADGIEGEIQRLQNIADILRGRK